MRTWLSLAGVVAVALGSGCGSSEPTETPAACMSPPSAYLTALRSAPQSVRLADGTPIGDCLPPEQEAGPLQSVGRSLIGAASRLNARARRSPNERAAVELGYLSGAVEEATSGTGGIHRDLELRLESAARYSPQGKAFSTEFERAFARGYAAGRESG